jgi:hypothetical protein
MTAEATMQELNMIGGPLHRLGRRLGLVRDGMDTILLGVVLGLLAWSVLAVLALLYGLGPKIFSLNSTALHVRLLLAIPLFFVCETWIFPEIAEFPRYLVQAGMVRDASLPALASAIGNVVRLLNSSVAELLLLVLAIAGPLMEMVGGGPGRSGNFEIVLQNAGGLNWATGWYLGFCLPLFRFLLLRWLWRLGLWVYFLWQVKKLNLRLMPTHSDGAGGLGYLEIVHEHFAPLTFAISALFSAQFAENFVGAAAPFETMYSSIPLVLLLAAALFIGPLCIFSSDLWHCRVNGMSHYMSMASRYVNAFDERWIQDKTATGESQLGAADLQSLADLSNSLNVAREMRPIPAGPRLLTNLAAAAILPLAPLLLLKYPVDKLAAQLFQALTGL